MADQPALFRSRQTWQHFIGGYYSSPEKFLAEAGRVGISRRVPANVAKGMRFGDRVVLLRWGRDPRTKEAAVFAFAEMIVGGVTLADGLGGEVGKDLAAEGRARFNDSGAGLVQRDCGSYLVIGTWEVEADLDEVIERAQAKAAERGVECFVMVNGSLSRVYDQPVLLQPAPKFHRGFARIPDEASFVCDPEAEAPAGSLVLVSGYQKA